MLELIVGIFYGAAGSFCVGAAVLVVIGRAAGKLVG